MQDYFAKFLPRNFVSSLYFSINIDINELKTQRLVLTRKCLEF